ncbi:hypothetical protein [Aquimarina sp. RZ0]|uniref:hypothetical protein n=1 Tax=Aquimarina sp. RZ0 TaxID=2607730 RepID=UPI0011F4013F|nr:hypothetical protein [Aquimarina sp. RZ0]KAA1243093.1 hypothetical protein F0000_22595 [Aquimarina sp. RZ0]
MKRATKASSQMAHLVMEIQESDTITKRQIALYKRLLKKESSMIIYLKDDSSTIRLRKLFQDKQLPFKIN